MVAAIERVIGVGLPVEAGCKPLSELITEDHLVPQISQLRREGINLDTINVPVNTRNVDYRVTGCIPEHTHNYSRARLHVSPAYACDEREGGNCDTCILNLPNGSKILKSLLSPEIMIVNE